MKTMHLFAGAGGGLLADLILGHDPIIAVEWDGYACQVLRERAADGWFPNLQVWEGDVRDYLRDTSEYDGSVGCISAGFPCVDISTAGKRAGIVEGTRSGLYREVIRISMLVRPDYIFLENVSAIVGLGLGDILADLSKVGYDSRWCCLRASDVGALHHRDRWWLLAHSNGKRGRSWNAKRENASATWEPPRDSRGNSAGMGYWNTESNVGRVANGVPNRVHRLKALGNAQVPLQAAVAWKLLGGQ